MKTRLSNAIPSTTIMFMIILAIGCGPDTATETPASSVADTATAEATAESQSPSQPAGKIYVVTTSNIVADWVRAVGQDRVEVFSLLPPDTDAHTYQPGARDISRVADAELVFSIGLSLEAGWLDELVRNAAQDPAGIVALGDAVDPIDFVEIFEDDDHGEADESDEDHGEADQDDEDHGHDHGALDPHFWFDPLRVQQAVNSISARLSTVDPAGQTLYRDNAAAYNRELDGLHAWITEQVEILPENRRVLVTLHDSFQYFAQRYGFKIVGSVFPVSTESEPTAQDLTALIETMEREGARAVFTEKSHSERLGRRIAEETGAKHVGGLYTGSLGEPGGGAGTYLDLMRYNVETIVGALR